MKDVNTILGRVSADELGRTLIHEHLGDAGDFCVRNGIPGWIDVQEMTEYRIRTAKNAMSYGVQTMVDCSTMNLGRCIPMMEQICKKTGLNIIPATGFYYPDMLWEYSASDEAIFRILMRDIEQGMDGTDVKAGVIKCAIGASPMTKTNERILRASAKAHMESGVPIVTHTEYCNRGGTLQQDIFESEGVDLTTVMIGHVGDTNDIAYIESILDRGSYIGLDRFSQDEFNPLEKRCETLATLVQHGWEKRIMISHDYPLYMGVTFWAEADRDEMEKNTHALTYIHTTVLPMLRSMGVSESALNDMLTENPKRFFAGAPADRSPVKAES